MNNVEMLSELKIFFDNMYETAVKKNADYAGSSIEKDPFANFRQVEKMGICSTEVGMLTRMTDKFCRINNIISSGEIHVKSESIEDTLMDLSNYSALLAIYLRSKKKLMTPPVPK